MSVADSCISEQAHDMPLNLSHGLVLLPEDLSERPC
jgi:hypothetical protein